MYLANRSLSQRARHLLIPARGHLRWVGGGGATQREGPRSPAPRPGSATPEPRPASRGRSLGAQTRTHTRPGQKPPPPAPSAAPRVKRGAASVWTANAEAPLAVPLPALPRFLLTRSPRVGREPPLPLQQSSGCWADGVPPWGPGVLPRMLFAGVFIVCLSACLSLSL